MSKKESKTTEILLTEISEKLDRIISVLAISGKNTDTQIEILYGFKWEWDEIGKLVGMNGSAARMRHARKQKENTK